MIARAAAVACVCAIAAGCVTKLNQAAFGVATDLPVAMLDGLSAVLASGGAPVAQKSWALGAGSKDYLPSQIVVFTVGDKLPDVDLTIVGTLGGNEVVRRRARTTLLPEQSRFVRLALEARCVGVACADDQTCVEGVCAGVDVDLTRALPYAAGQEYGVDCDDPMFRFTYDDTLIPPPDGGVCASAQRCVEGTCYVEPGAPALAGAGNFATGTLADFQIR